MHVSGALSPEGNFPTDLFAEIEGLFYLLCAALGADYDVRSSPHRRWVQETQPHTYEYAERILTAEF